MNTEKVKKELKDKIVEFRLTKSVYAMLEQKAKEEQKTVSVALRELVNSYINK